MSTATEKQVQFATSLGRDLVDLMGDDGERAEIVQWYRDMWPTLVSDRQAMSDAITGMITLLRDWRASTAPTADVYAPQQQQDADLEGMHRLDGRIYKVQRAVHGSGHLYAKRLVEDGDGGWTFEYAAGAIRNLSESTRMTLEEAKEFGTLYGTCCVCGRTLTDENSIAAGIGPVCAGKF